MTNDEQTVDEYAPATNHTNETESNATGSALKSYKFVGVIDIILHPIYQVPCPYMRLFDIYGQPVTESMIQVLTSSWESSMQSRSTEPNNHPSSSLYGSDNVPVHCDDDISHVAIGDTNFIYEEHPYSQSPCLCLHVCGVGERLGLIESIVTGLPATLDSRKFEKRNSDVNSKYQNKEVDSVNRKEIGSSAPDLYFLNWMMLVAPKIGFQVTSSFYKNASASLR